MRKLIFWFEKVSGSQCDLLGCENSFLGRLPLNSVHLSRDFDAELTQQDLHTIDHAQHDWYYWVRDLLILKTLVRIPQRADHV